MAVIPAVQAQQVKTEAGHQGAAVAPARHETRGEIMADIERAGGVHYMYPEDQPKPTAAPKGYKPFYISHLGRHGARYALGSTVYRDLLEVWTKGHENGWLTPKGEELYKAYVEWEDWNRAWKAEHPDPWGELGVDDSYTETPDNYWRYEAFFAEQGEALDAIAAKYGLTLLSEHYYIRSETQLCRALGLDDLA